MNIIKTELINGTYHKTFICNQNKKLLKNPQKRNPALFLDRDGVLIKDCNYIKDPKDVKILKGAELLLINAKSLGWNVVVVSNQSGISRGFFSWNDYEKVNLEMNRLIDKKCNIDAIYASGNSPEDLTNNWRKPNPNMLFEAKKDLNVHLEDSIIIGDRITDLIAGQKAGLKLLVHVLTGHGKKERQLVLDYYNLTPPENFEKPFLRKLNNSRQKIFFINNLLQLEQKIFLS